MAKARPQASPLAEYRTMRDFAATPEPRGKVQRAKGALYTIQKHAARRLHYDLRLELDGVLKSWALTKGPSADPTVKRLAVRTEDHPLEYPTFEGRIPAGQYGAGSVLLWDRGTWEPLEDPRAGLARGKLSFALHGERLRGRWTLVRMRPKGREARENWLFVKARDDSAQSDHEPTETFSTSVLSGRDLEAVRAAPDAVWSRYGAQKVRAAQGAASLPKFVPPALARLVDAIPSGAGWLFEIKLDGYRALAAVSGTQVRIDTRSGLDWTARFGNVARALAKLELDGVLLDGEIIAVDAHGRANFSALQDALSSGRGGLSYFVFDLLVEQGQDLRRLPQDERKRRLKALLQKVGAADPIHFSDALDSGGERMLRELCERGFEGVIAKRADAPYRSGRGAAWLKIKCENAQEFVIVGWSPSPARRPFASLLLAVQQDGALRYAGRVGAGFSERDLEQIAAELAPLARKTPAVQGVPAAIARRARWVAPKKVAQVVFSEFTAEGSVRHGRFVELRSDKAPGSIVREVPRPLEQETRRPMKKSAGKATSRRESAQEERVAGVRLTHPERVLYPEQGLSKLDLARYLEAVSGRMLPHAARRLLSLVRCPEGRTKECFFQRHATKGMPAGLSGFELEERAGRSSTYLYLTGEEGLVAAAQMGALELHLWGSHIDLVERPDRLVLDLDPDPELPFERVREAALELRSALEALGLVSFPLATGGKGVHVVAPLRRTLRWEQLKAFARGLAEQFAAHDPARFLAKPSKAARKGRIYLDYLRNDRAATAIAPYSLRARAGAPVACPLTWAELADLPAADAFGVKEVLKRVRAADPWKGYFELNQTLRADALRAVS